MSTVNDELLQWFAGALEPAAEDAFEERLFDDASDFAPDVARLLDVRDALRAMAAAGPVVPVVTHEELRALGASSSVTEHRPVDGRITTRIGAEEYIAAHLPLAVDVPRVHVLFCTPAGVTYFRVNEAPYDAATGELVVLCKAHVARAAGTLVVRVVDDAERVLGEVTLENLT